MSTPNTAETGISEKGAGLVGALAASCIGVGQEVYTVDEVLQREGRDILAYIAQLELDRRRLDGLEEIGREGSIGVTKQYVLIKADFDGRGYFYDSLREAADAELRRRECET